MDVEEPLPWGRSFEEYVLIFGLTESALGGGILAVADGPSSFNALATARGYRIVSCDPIYDMGGVEIRRRVEGRLPKIVTAFQNHADQFVWDMFGSPTQLAGRRQAAMSEFFADYERGRQEGRYVPARLPVLPFGDGQFPLALVSHLLFLYSQLLDLQFHLASVRELLRVAAEVRIFPLVALDTGRLSQHLDPVLEYTRQGGFRAEITSSGYEFQKAPNRAGKLMLTVHSRQ